MRTGQRGEQIDIVLVAALGDVQADRRRRRGPPRLIEKSHDAQQLDEVVSQRQSIQVRKRNFTAGVFGLC
ncbi:MAG TPA: hypothetical protein VFU81_20300, partial [Thermomicrobiales bacterium]|nr:hypothetical protein [Thermomicrobiales bacterium]